jgi:serine/threonine protein kinase
MLVSILSSLALKPVVLGVCSLFRGGRDGGGDGDSRLFDVDDMGDVVKFLSDRFFDQSMRLSEALKSANDRAWRALELALAGESFWSWLDSKEDKAFRQQLRAFFDAHPLLDSRGRDDMKKICLADLRAARKAGLLGGELNDPQALAREAGEFARFSDPLRLLEVEWAMIARLGDAIHKSGYPALAELVGRRSQDTPLLVLAARYFFNNIVETDQALFQGLAYARLEAVAHTQAAGFDALDRALRGQGERLEELLGAFAVVMAGLDEIKGGVEEVKGGVLDVKEEQGKLAEHLRQLHQDVLRALERNQMERRELRPRDSLSIRNDAERRLVKQLMDRYRALPPGQQQQMPALLNALGRLQVGAGEYESAQRSFERVAALAPTPHAEAEAHFNGYRTALERRDWGSALIELRRAAQLDPARFSVLPDKYQPKRILGAGGFGVAFLCQHAHLGECVVKALLRDEMDSDPELVFAEAAHLRRLDHPSIVRVQDCGFVDPAARARPFLVMEYFDGPSLEDYVRQGGPVKPAALPGLARRVAEGLRAAHQKNILHRDVKPGNVLVRKDGNGWEVKLIDFGLAMHSRSLSSTARALASGQSILAGSIAGTLEYAAPEQMGKLPGVPVGAHSDVYGFGKTLCYALFQSAQPTPRDWKGAGERLSDLLGDCVEERPDRRLPNFPAVLARLEKLTERPSGSFPKPPPTPTPPPPPLPPRRAPVETTKIPALPIPPFLDAEPADEPPTPPPLPPPPPPPAPGPQVRRNKYDLVVSFRGHTLCVECGKANNFAQVIYDGRQVARGWPAPEATYRFSAVEEGQPAHYEVVVRGTRHSVGGFPLFTVRRNGVVLHNDR